jgi:hypothetical protein
MIFIFEARRDWPAFQISKVDGRMHKQNLTITAVLKR